MFTKRLTWSLTLSARYTEGGRERGHSTMNPSTHTYSLSLPPSLSPPPPCTHTSITVSGRKGYWDGKRCVFRADISRTIRQSLQTNGYWKEENRWKTSINIGKTNRQSLKMDVYWKEGNHSKTSINIGRTNRQSLKMNGYWKEGNRWKTSIDVGWKISQSLQRKYLHVFCFRPPCVFASWLL